MGADEQHTAATLHWGCAPGVCLLALLCLFAMVPAGPAPRTGPPVAWQARSPSVQLALSNRPAMRRFRARWGAQGLVRFDETTGAPRFVAFSGVPAGQRAAVVDALADLAGVDGDTLVAQAPERRGERRWHRYARTWRGAPVLHDEVLVLEQGGALVAAWLRLRVPDGALHATPAPGESVLLQPQWKHAQAWTAPADHHEVHLVQTAVQDGIVTHVNRRGEAVLQWSERYHDDVQLEVLERTVGDSRITVPARGVSVWDAAGVSDTTADDGSHALTGPLTVTLDGPELQVWRRGALVSATQDDEAGTVTLEGSVEISEAAATVQHHFHEVWDWLEARRADHPWLGSQVRAEVDISSAACNAYYTSGTVNFYVGAGSRCHNFGQIADVVYHEVGHGIHHYILAGGTFAGDISEGSADYISSTILGDGTVGENARPDGSSIRELETDRVYPEDATGQVHNDGLIWGSFFWNLRAQWEADLGDPAGIEATDALLLGALEQGPTLTDAYEAVILADDDNGDLSDGTPHACELAALLDQHGLGPGPIGVLSLDHVPLGPQASTARSYPVDFSLYDATQGCSDYDPSTVQLWFRTTPPAVVPGTASADEDPYRDWTSLPLSTDGVHWTGALPRQLATTELWYFIEASTSDGSETVWSHGGGPEGVYRFQVGDREALWCEDFETGDAPGWELGAGSLGSPRDIPEEWAVGVPAGGRFVPDSAVSGHYALGTQLAGEHNPNTEVYAWSPEQGFDPDDRMLALSFQRYLSVEDARYDHARVYVDDALVFENPATSAGSHHTLDTDWVLQDVPLVGLPQAEDGRARFGWTLDSDGGLEFGGWALDQVCIVRLADEAAHYRRVDLWAESDAEGVHLRFDTPWIDPLADVVLVRQDGAWPDTPTEGTELWRGTGLAPGQSQEVREPPLGPEEDRHYVVFAAAEPGVWMTERVVGDNALRLASRPPEPVDTGPFDTGWVASDAERPVPDPEVGDAPAEDAEPDPVEPGDAGGKGSGCATAGSGPAGGLLLSMGGLLWLRRRRWS